MAHTSEQRDRHALCGARKKNGDLCRKFAGEGTDHFGVGRCKYHLGNSKNHRVNAVKQEAVKRSATFGQKIDVQPTEALLSVLHLSAGHLAWVREELAAAEDQKSFEAQVLMRLWNDERDRVARIAKTALDAGVQERQVALAEQYGIALAELLRRIFHDPELGLSGEQQSRLPEVVRRHMAVVPQQAALTA